MGKARRKDTKECASVHGHKLYLEEAVLEKNVSETNLKQLVELPPGLGYEEWLASHTIDFFHHANLLYGTVSEFCTLTGCPDMTGPGLRQYLWFDEKGKKARVAAPQYVDYVMTFAQNTVNDETIFPTKFENDFPSSFESIVKKILRLLFHVLAHLYHSHFREVVLLTCHAHLNGLFTHFILFSQQFQLIDEKELDVLNDLIVALKLNQNQRESENQESELEAGDDQGSGLGPDGAQGSVLGPGDAEGPQMDVGLKMNQGEDDPEGSGSNQRDFGSYKGPQNQRDILEGSGNQTEPPGTRMEGIKSYTNQRTPEPHQMDTSGDGSAKTDSANLGFSVLSENHYSSEVQSGYLGYYGDNHRVRGDPSTVHGQERTVIPGFGMSRNLDSEVVTSEPLGTHPSLLVQGNPSQDRWDPPVEI